MKSAFLAIPLENQAKWQFQALQEELKSYEDIFRFQNPQSPHLTLHFWAELMQIEWDPIIKKAKDIAASSNPFSLKVTHAGTFGSRGEDRVLNLRLAFSEELARIKKACPWPDGKEFKPHITLARIRHPQKFQVHKKRIMKLLDNCEFKIPIDRLRIYAEIDGRKQTPLQDFEL